MNKIGIVQWGTKHGHAKGWLELLMNSSEINFYGVFESDKELSLIHISEPTRPY